MFNNLIESRPTKQKTMGGTIFSVVFHTAVIGAAVYGTLEAKEQLEKPKQPPPPRDVVAAPPPPKGFQVLTAPVKIPDVLPDIDLSKKVTNEDDFTGKGVAGGIAKGVVGGTAPVQTDQAYFEFQVEKQVHPASGNPPPRYPDMLRSANVEGEVLAQFVVDTTGRADMGTFKVLKSSHDLFTNAVRSTLPNMRFYAAEIGGRKVKQLVQMPFQFALTK